LMYSSTLPKTPAVFFFCCRDNFNPEMMMTFKRKERKKIFWTSRAALLYVKAQTGREQRGNKNDDLMRKSRRRGTVNLKIKIRKVTQVRQGNVYSISIAHFWFFLSYYFFNVQLFF
jgi:hypothetical protein